MSVSAIKERSSVTAMLADLEFVGGPDLVSRLLFNFADRLTELLHIAVEPRPWTRADAHVLAGVAGMLGFERLAELSRIAMETNVATPPPRLRAAAFDALRLSAEMLGGARAGKRSADHVQTAEQ